MSSKLLKIYDLFRSVGGNISTDSRNIAQGALFFALRGESFDGNLYAESALHKGASAAIIDDKSLADTKTGDGRYIYVDDVLDTLSKLARHHRRTLSIPILAITGSNGKTTTKELVSRVLSEKFNVYATKGNLNNHIGVPLTLLSMNDSTQFGVVEMGANHCGEIAHLCRIAEPDYGIITNIGKAHLEGFGGYEGVMRGKGELFDYLLNNNGLAFFLEDSPQLKTMVEQRDGMSVFPFSPIRFGFKTINTDPLKFTAFEGVYGINTSLTGSYNIYNISAAIAVALYFEIPMDRAIFAIESYVPDNCRSQVKQSGTNILYLDAYNANPSSMEASLKNFASVKSDNKIAILGEMRELGEFSVEEHRRIAELALGLSLSRVVLIGKSFSEFAKKCEYYETLDEFKENMKKSPISNSAILIKASNGMKLYTLEDVL